MTTPGAFGLRPIRKLNGKWTGQRSAYLLANGYGTALYEGDPVTLSAGQVVKAAMGDYVLGVFLGSSYTDATGSPVMNNMFPAATSIPSGSLAIDAIAGIAQPVAYVCDDPGVIMAIVADTSISIGGIGLNYRVSLGAGSNTSGLSGAVLKVASGTTQGQNATSASSKTMVRVLGPVNGIVGGNTVNAIGNANPLLEVMWIANQANFTTAQ